MSSENEEVQHLLNRYPGDFSFRGKLLHVFPLALEEFNKLSKKNWPLDNYQISVSVSDDESYAAISFLPDIANVVEGIPFEIASRGMYKNGMGVTYIYRLEDRFLVKKTYMR
jgi:hypothetical protein